MKVSVIVPVYNCEKYLVDCLDSVLAQTYPVHEIILVDDGSKDESGRICDEYAVKDCRFRVIHQENCGVSRARNVGMSCVTGDVVSFIDSDDTLESDMYELLVGLLEKYHADVAHCGFNRVERDSIKPIYATNKLYTHTSEQAVEKLLQGELYNGALWNKLYRSDTLCNLSFCEGLKNNEDILFNFEVFCRAKLCVFFDVAKYNYFVRENVSACFTIPKEKQIKDSLYVSNYVYEHSISKRGKQLAAERLMRTLSSAYRVLEGAAEKRATARKIWDIYKAYPNVGFGLKVSVVLIRFCPIAYLFVRKLYEKLYPPIWEV